MYRYTISQWIIFFFWYCFLGWIWECCYVSSVRSYKNRKLEWVNRGFLNGPVLPIYGFAAVSILIGTMQVRDNLFMIFVMGALAATLMELVTGSTMERLFHVKYWDYSHLPLNYKGHICFFISLFWGVLSVVLVEVIHVPAEQCLLKCPLTVTEGIAFALVAVFAYDFSDSLKAAMDMKELLEKLTESRVVIDRLEKRVDAVIAFTAIPDIAEIKDLPRNAKESLHVRVENARNRRVDKLERLKEKISSLDLEQMKDREELVAQLDRQIRAVFARSNRQFYRAVRHLRHNPTAKSGKYREAMEELKALWEEKE